MWVTYVVKSKTEVWTCQSMHKMRIGPDMKYEPGHVVRAVYKTSMASENYNQRISWKIKT